MRRSPDILCILDALSFGLAEPDTSSAGWIARELERIALIEIWECALRIEGNGPARCGPDGVTPTSRAGFAIAVEGCMDPETSGDYRASYWRHYKELAELGGVEDMVRAYYAGVPLEDVLGGEPAGLFEG